jgi:hypothetical protein
VIPALLLLILFLMMIIFVLSSTDTVRWSEGLRRVSAGSARRAEWMASEAVVDQVKQDYLAAMTWLAEASLGESLHLCDHYLSGNYLRRFQTLLPLLNGEPRRGFVGILDVRHHVQVRQFSEDGLTCLVVDSQTERRMETYDVRLDEHVQTQDLGDGVVVYRMVYDRLAHRWKIASFIQELPPGWREQPAARVRLYINLPAASGHAWLN